jgi:hypothetical protein
MRGLAPRIHQNLLIRSTMDCRVKPGNDGGETATLILASP